MRVGIVSDLHIEFVTHPHPTLLNPCQTEGDILIVAGDLVPAAFLRSSRTDANARSVRRLLQKVQKNLFSRYGEVLYVMGNHEHYHSVFSETQPVLEEYFGEMPVKLLEDDFCSRGGVNFVGCTLWSDFAGRSPVSIQAAKTGMADYEWIWRHDPSKLSYKAKQAGVSYNITPEMTLDKFDASKAYLQNVLASHRDQPTVVITHHGPTFKSLNSQHAGNLLDGAYCSELSDLILDNPQIKMWVHGHVHENKDYYVGDTRILSNNIGYYFEQSFRDFSGVVHFEI